MGNLRLEKILKSLEATNKSGNEYELYTQLSNAIPELRNILQEMSGRNVGGVYISYYDQAENDLTSDIYEYLVRYIKANRPEDLKKYRLVITEGAMTKKLCVTLTGRVNKKKPIIISSANCNIFDVLQMNRFGFLSKDGYEKFQETRKTNPEYFLSYIKGFEEELDKIAEKAGGILECQIGQ